MDHESHLRLLGLTTARSHQLELVTAQILARSLRVDESTARLLTTNMGLGSTIGVLNALARGDSGSLVPSMLREWVPKAKAANEARNRVVHSPWVSTEFGEPVSVVAKGSMRLEARSESDLRADIGILESAVDSGYELLRHRP